VLHFDDCATLAAMAFRMSRMRAAMLRFGHHTGGRLALRIADSA
jgi:hypothetical protein